MKRWISQKPSARDPEEADPSFPSRTAAGKLPHQYSWIIAWISPEASELSESFSLACGYRNYCSLNGQSSSKSQNKYLHLRCNYESKTIQAQGTPSSTLFSFSAGLFSVTRQSPERCQDSVWCERLEMPLWQGQQAVACVHASVFARPNQCQ